MPLSSRAAEPSDCWVLVGVDDPVTPPTVARVLNTVGSRGEWRRAGLPVLFDENGNVKHVVRAGREYRFQCVDDGTAARLPHCRPLVT
jgi:CTP:molybdopterin cytidylyltransferase MocA